MRGRGRKVPEDASRSRGAKLVKADALLCSGARRAVSLQQAARRPRGISTGLLVEAFGLCDVPRRLRELPAPTP
eukprot:s3494_g9.t1